MSFEWPRIHKWEERVEQEVSDSVFEYVCEHYGVDEIDELTPIQLKEIEDFRDELNEYSVFQIGFSNLIGYVENIHWENENNG
jgi:Mn-dependent DtxR family transcriptional regulator